jgi:hypothetical protein
MKYSEWVSWKEYIVSKYQPEKVMSNNEDEFSFKLGGYGFRFRARLKQNQIEGEEVDLAINPQYCFLHIGVWKDIRTFVEVKVKLNLAKEDADKNERFEDLDNIPAKAKKIAAKREKKIVFKRK